MIEYNIVFETAAGEVITIDWGNHPGWEVQYKEKMETAVRIALFPKRLGALPPVTVELGGGRRWLAFCKTVGVVNGGKHIHPYAVGWQMTTGTRNIKTLIWIYPDGCIEVAEKPSYISRYFK
jgi:hypothetical protein